MKTASREAERLLGAGFWPVALAAPGEKIKGGTVEAVGKEPIRKSWGLKRAELDELRRLLSAVPGRGLGLCLGPGRGPGGAWLIDLEGDGPEAEASRLAILGGELVESMGWTSARGSHQLLIVDEEKLGPILARLKGFEVKGTPSPGVYKLDELPGLELRIGGRKADGTVKQLQSACPPTPGTDGRPREWSGAKAVLAAPDAFYATLERIAAAASSTRSSPATADRRVKPAPRRRGIWATSGADVIDRARAYVAKMPAAISGQGGHNATIAVANALRWGFDLGAGDALAILHEYNARCEPQWSDSELAHKCESGDQACPSGKARGHLRNAPPPEANGKHRRAVVGGVAQLEPGGFAPTDLGNAERFAAQHGANVRYCHPWKKWLAFDGMRWKADTSGEVQRLAFRTVRSIYAEAAAAADDQRRRELGEWAVASERRERIKAMLGLAESLPGIPIDPAEMDADPWAFNCTNGTIDLHTGQLRPHRREDLITKLCPWEFDPTARAPLWEKTLATFFAREDEADQADLIAYLARLCGYALTGVVRDHVLPIFYGKGSNGKSTILGGLLDAFGDDYGMKAPSDLLMVKRGDSHPTDKASLFGKRLVVAIETEEGRPLSEVTVKDLTGGDTISARRMREDFWTFKPTHTLVMATNHKPVIRGTDKGIWRRIRLVPFTVTMDDDQADKAMPEKLRAEMPGILAWCVRGCLDWRRIGLEPPTEVSNATAEYRGEQDVLAAFLGEWTVAIPDPAVRVKASDLYARYREWAETSGETVWSHRRFGEAMRERSYEKLVSNGVWYVGLGLKEPEAAQSEGVSKGRLIARDRRAG